MLIVLLACTTTTGIVQKKDEVAVIRYSPSSLAFLEGDGPKVVTVESAGNVDLLVSAVLQSGSGSFSLTSEALPGTLPAGESADLVVTWTPEGEDASGSLTISSNDPSLPEAEVALVGTLSGDTGKDTGDTGDTASDTGDTASDTGDTGGDTGDTGNTTAPELQLSPSGWDYGTLASGTTGTATFRLSNIGTAQDRVLQLTSSDSHFQILTTAPFDLAPGSYQDIQVTFQPDAASSFAGTLTVDAQTSSDPTASLVGTGHQSQSNQFVWTGSTQTWTVPAAVSVVTIKAWGAGGGAGDETAGSVAAGGGGGFATVTAAVSPGEVLYIRPGQGGIAPGGGGGASVVTRSDGTYLVVAGGGGGGGTDGGSPLTQPGDGGAGGGEDGADQVDTYWGYATGGTSGTSASGGNGGLGVAYAASGPACSGEAGSSLYGGGGAYGWTSCSYSSGAKEDVAGTASSNGAGGGGGAGWYGGGGGGSLYTYFGGGGGGGSSYPTAGAVSGSGDTPGNSADPDYSGGWGVGGVPGSWPKVPSTDGTGGYVVIQ